MIKNPAYKGKWVHPEIDNPDYAPDSEIYSFADFGRIGLDLWQVRYQPFISGRFNLSYLGESRDNLFELPHC